jgi:hypothetical protein
MRAIIFTSRCHGGTRTTGPNPRFYNRVQAAYIMTPIRD